jgi:hypothetical protein
MTDDRRDSTGVAREGTREEVNAMEQIVIRTLDKIETTTTCNRDN